MRPLLAALASLALPGCLLDLSPDDEDPPPTANPCGPAEAPLMLQDGPYGSGVAKLGDVAAYPSFRSDYPKRLVFERSKSSARIEYFHEDKAVVETWTVGPLSTPVEGQCNVTGHERGTLTIASVTIDGVAGDLSRYDGADVTLMAGATVTYRLTDGSVSSIDYRHGFSPSFSQSCFFRRPVDGAACNETAICAYDTEGEHCTTRCADGVWKSFSCGG